MHSNERKINKLFLYWLSFSLVLIFFIIIIGGLTRLTNSGLSITEWELFKGILPPLNSSSWNTYFEEYKKIPQYKLLNFNMTLDDFKIIFYWEYFHRMLARIIGLFFLIPLIFFYFSKKVNKEYMKSCILIFFLILVQGAIGWFMVKSGLVDDVSVSHYRLSIHLITAILIISSIFWLLMNIISNRKKIFFNFSKINLPFQILILFIFIQIVVGAFVSGLDAGKIYQTWPLMGNSYFPNDVIIKNISDLLDFDNHSIVQFFHRNLAYIIFVLSIFYGITLFKSKNKNIFNSYMIYFFLLLTQVFLGILVLLSGSNLYIASFHQISSIFLIISLLNLYHKSIER